jgi:hypothetical protein
LTIMPAASAQPGAMPRVNADAIVNGWPATPKKVAMEMIGKYGQPNEATPSMLVWHRNGPWKRTVLTREETPHEFPMAHTDLLEQVVDYQVPPAAFDELAQYDGSVIIERTKGEMSARCDKEEMNMLALNLANDIVQGKRSVADARAFYATTAMAFKKGEKPPYTQRLQFDPEAMSEDMDMPVLPPPTTVAEIIRSWSPTAQEVANAMIAKYGQPNEFTPAMLVWQNNGPWKRTIVNRDVVAHHFPKPHPDLLEQVIDYRAPTDRFDELAEYDGSVIAERTKGEISARCDKEGLNFLAINLANDVATGKRSVEDARRFYAENAKKFTEGEKPPYTQGLQFTRPTAATADPDQPFPPK